MKRKYKGMLILGATGAGKTPLGQQMEIRDLWYNTYHHFDFGQIMRDVAAGRIKEVLESEEIERVKKLLASNDLMENEDFPIAEKLLKNFIEEREVCQEDVIILNGFPRHVGQAEALSSIIDIKFVLFLNVPPEIAYERIKMNAGGDRADRSDDSLEEIKKKIDIFYNRTFPLIEYFRQQDKNIVEVAVDIDTLPLFIIQDLGVLDKMV